MSGSVHPASPVSRLPARLCLCLLLAAGCITGYRPRGILGAGFSEQKLDRDLWLVTFDASAFTPQKRVEDYLMLRCAEITVQNGARYFAVLPDQSSRRRTATMPTLIDKPPYPMDLASPPPARTSARSARAAIRLYREKPEEESYDARDLIRKLSPQARPQ